MRERKYIYALKVYAAADFYTIHLSWCIKMGRQWCFLLVHGGGGFRVLQHQTPSPKWPSWNRSNSNSHPGSQPAHPHKEKKKKTTEKALYIILQQPIRAKLYWWLLNLSFKNQEATLLLLFGHNDIRLFVYSGMYFFLFYLKKIPFPFFYIYRKKNEILISKFKLKSQC